MKPLRFHHSDALWSEFPTLVAGVLHAEGISPDRDADRQVAAYCAVAERRLAGTTESELPEIQAWRRAYARMGLKPTRYRCASESLLRRFRKEEVLPRVHPLVDLCNAVSMAFAIPVAALDTAEIVESVEVRHATGDETYVTFGGTIENPAPGEVTFADAAGNAHARRWTNRQSGRSAVSPKTSTVLIVAEALHDTAPDDIHRLVSTLADELSAVWSTSAKTAVLSRAGSEFVV